MADVFISYSKGDRSIIQTLAAQIEKAGYSVWWDTELIAGENFRKAINRAPAEGCFHNHWWAIGHQQLAILEGAHLTADAFKTPAKVILADDPACQASPAWSWPASPTAAR